jgi:hypothetical protein
MKAIIRTFDHILARTLGLWVYWDDPQSLLRIRVIGAPHVLRLADGDIAAGARVVELHFWNDRTPPFPAEGPDLAWATGFYRRLVASFRVLARQLATNPDLAGVRALGGVTVLVSVGGSPASEKLFDRLGFDILPYRSPLGRFGLFWENLYTWALMWAYNGLSRRQRHLLELQRSEVWMSTATFLRRHGEGGAKRPGDG